MLYSCPRCYREKGFSVRLNACGGALVCAHDASHRFVIERGFLRELNGGK